MHRCLQTGVGVGWVECRQLGGWVFPAFACWSPGCLLGIPGGSGGAPGLVVGNCCVLGGCCLLLCCFFSSVMLDHGLSEVPPILPLCLLRTTISSSRVSRANILPYSTISPSCFKKKTNLISIQRHQVKYGALPNLRVHISLPQEYLGSCHL